jgi:hypothetical protein
MAKKLERAADGSFSIPVIQRQAEIKSFDAEKKSAEMVFSTGSRVMRFDWDLGPFIEELSMQAEHVNLSRVAAGSVPFMKDHARGVDDVLGRVTQATVDGKQGVATVLFSSRAEVQPTIKDIQDGILPSVSVGYRVNVFQKAGEEKGVPILRAIDWELFEVSSVAIPADANAQFRGETQNAEDEPKLFRCQVLGIETRTETVSENNSVEESNDVTQTSKIGAKQMNEAELKLAEEKRVADAKIEGAKAERQRQDEIRKAVRAASLDESFGETLIKEGVEIDAARSRVIDELARADRAKPTASARVEAGELDETKTRRDGISEAILARALPGTYKVTDRAREYHAMSLVEMAKESLVRSGVKVSGMSRLELAGRAMHSTSDFPEILAGVVNKSLRDAFLAAPQTFAPFVRRVQNADFKQISRVQLGMGSELEELPEGGEISHGTYGEAAEKYSIKEYAKAISISRKTLVNDDLDALARIPAAMGAKARSLESKLVWGVITTNAAMADGVALFHANHGNLSGSAGAPSVTTLGDARAAMRLQKDMDGEPLILQAQWLIVPVALETVAEQLVAQIQPQQSSNVNPFASGGRTPMGIIVEPRLDAVSTSVWYAAASLQQVDMLELATISGSGEPEVLVEQMFDSTGMKMRVVHSVGVKAIDWRGLYKNA